MNTLKAIWKYLDGKKTGIGAAILWVGNPEILNRLWDGHAPSIVLNWAFVIGSAVTALGLMHKAQKAGL